MRGQLVGCEIQFPENLGLRLLQYCVFTLHIPFLTLASPIDRAFHNPNPL